MSRTLRAAAARLRARSPLLAATVLASAASAMSGTPVAIRAVAGLWLLLGAPVILGTSIAGAFTAAREARVLLGTGLALTADLWSLLLLNALLPHLGQQHPLTPVPLAATALTVSVLGAVSSPVPQRDGPPLWRRALAAQRLPAGLGAVTAVGGSAVLLAVAGAIRLNNGFSGSTSMASLVLVAVLLALLLSRRNRYSGPVLALGVFLAAAAVLLMTSLRGWYITGHDIQREYEVYLLASTGDHWSIAQFRDPYNACLSITLLPTAFAKLTGIPGVYVFKAVFPLLFATTPVLVMRAARNLAPASVALLSAVYFIAFPTFFTDMTFLARQEIAFLLLGCATMVITERERPLAARRAVFLVLLSGIVLSHYSTTYVVTLSLATGLACDLLWRGIMRLRARGGRHRTAAAFTRGFVTLWMVAAVAAGALLWTGPVTHTSGQLRSTLTGALQDLLGENTLSASSDTQYSLVGGTSVTPEQRLAAYRTAMLKATQHGRGSEDYEKLAAVEAAATPVVPESVMPPTALGSALDRIGINVATVNGAVRQSVARLLQVLLLVGLLVTTVSRRRAFRAGRDQTVLAAGMLGVIGLLTVLPQLSIDYGVLRAFQQGLFVFAPFIAAGSLWLLRRLGRWSGPVAAAVALAFLLDLTGVVPKLLGGYPAQLHLSNSGQYYDIYYVHPEERTAIAWLQDRTTQAERADVQSEVQTDRYTFSRLQTVIRGRALNDIYPPLISTHSYVFLGWTTVTKDEATVFFGGDLLTYRYPTEFLDNSKDKIYSSDGAEVYR